MQRTFQDAVQRAHFSQLLDALPDGAYITDTERRILFWNRAAERITGWSKEEVQGRTCYDNILVHVDVDGHPLCGRAFCPLHRSMASGEQGCAPLLVFAKTRTGNRVPVEVTVAPFRGEGGEVIGGVEVFRDLAPLFRDLQRARTIQQHALAPEPFDDPRVDVATRFVPHDLVAGDFYRVARLADGCVALCVADVSGHGVAAALFCMQLRALWDDKASHGGMPENFVSEVNRQLSHTVGDEGYFASGFFGLYDPGRGCLRYVNAGHPAPWLLRVGGTVEVLDQRGAALGLFATASYRAVDVQLEPGDQLLAYTDGITGIMDRLGHEIGTEGLMAMFRAGRRESAGASLTSIEAQLLASCGKVRLPCDLTLLLLRRTG